MITFYQKLLAVILILLTAILNAASFTFEEFQQNPSAYLEQIEDITDYLESNGRYISRTEKFNIEPTIEDQAEYLSKLASKDVTSFLNIKNDSLKKICRII